MLVTDEKKIDLYYQALIERKQQFVGIFYVGVKTTAIFCIATCRARKPLQKNVVFYTTIKDALDNGFRPCKICKPAESANEAPEQIAKVIKLVKDNPKEKIADADLRAKGMSPEIIRRWFNQNYGMTFHTFQRMYRVSTAFQELKKGKKTTEIAYNTGYESLSGFGYTFKKLMGQSPKKSKGQSVLLISRVTTPLGPMFICGTDKGICLLEFVDREILEKEFKDLQRLLKTQIIAGENEWMKQAKKELKEYFNGQRKVFDVALHTPGTVFQNTYWTALKEVPYGTTTIYQQLAQKIGKPKAVRAVGAANGQNRICIIVPCHRVIGKNGKLRGFGGGLERKQWLLDHEAEFKTIEV